MRRKIERNIFAIVLALVFKSMSKPREINSIVFSFPQKSVCGIRSLATTEKNFSTWVYRITWNVAIDGRRQLAKRQMRMAKSTDEENSLDSESRPQDSPDLMQLHYEDVVRQGLEILSLEHRAVLVLHDLEDLPQKEIAQILEIPLGTVKSRLYYARKTMGQFLQKQGVI